MQESSPQTDQAATLDPVIRAVLIEGESPASISGIEPELLTSLYDKGHQHYQSGRYNDALSHFALLTMAAPLEKRHHMALGATWHQLNEYRNALKSYGNALLIDPCDPAPSLAIGQCLTILGDQVEARDALETAIEQSRTSQDYHLIGRKAAELLKSL